MVLAWRERMAVVRSWPRVLVATDQPSSSSPARASAGRTTSSRKTSLKWVWPPIWRSPRTVTLGACMSTTKHDRPRNPWGASPVRASSSPRSAAGPSDVHTFWPDTTHDPSSRRRARVLTAPRSEPASGSLKSWHQIVSAERMAGSSACWSGVPCSISVGPTMLSPITLMGSGA